LFVLYLLLSHFFGWGVAKAAPWGKAVKPKVETISRAQATEYAKTAARAAAMRAEVAEASAKAAEAAVVRAKAAEASAKDAQAEAKAAEANAKV
jgi:pyridoxine/pyridoxamine 5'-phosphate oxidase